MIYTNHVVAALIKNSKGEVYIQQRPLDKEYDGKWELPGGKVEEHETLEQAIIREIKEELNVDIYPVRYIGAALKVTMKVIAKPDNYLLHCIECIAKLELGEAPTFKPNYKHQWIKVDEIDLSSIDLIFEDKQFLVYEFLNDNLKYKDE
jgi:8-oxo-dGTP pyrophosphatase MutT (NUDIX family)